MMPTWVVVRPTEVVRPTWGTVRETAVVRVLEELGIVEPAPSVQGTTVVAVTTMVVGEAKVMVACGGREIRLAGALEPEGMGEGWKECSRWRSGRQ